MIAGSLLIKTMIQKWQELGVLKSPEIVVEPRCQDIGGFRTLKNCSRLFHRIVQSSAIVPYKTIFAGNRSEDSLRVLQS